MVICIIQGAARGTQHETDDQHSFGWFAFMVKPFLHFPQCAMKVMLSSRPNALIFLWALLSKQVTIVFLWHIFYSIGWFLPFLEVLHGDLQIFLGNPHIFGGRFQIYGQNVPPKPWFFCSSDFMGTITQMGNTVLLLTNCEVHMGKYLDCSFEVRTERIFPVWTELIGQ